MILIKWVICFACLIKFSLGAIHHHRNIVSSRENLKFYFTCAFPLLSVTGALVVSPFGVVSISHHSGHETLKTAVFPRLTFQDRPSRVVNCRLCFTKCFSDFTRVFPCLVKPFEISFFFQYVSLPTINFYCWYFWLPFMLAE
jgi:hypothetical protein